jgi:N4-(beta-N-acetylglucosaminyl)-L-asparaginase
MPQNDRLSRRQLLQAGIGAGLAATAGIRLAEAQATRPALRGMPVAISSANGMPATAKAMEMLREGADTLDAAVAGVNIVELDPSDTSVGYGGLPNERGDVELDASVMHGPTHRAGAVASLRGIKTPSLVAREVMRRTNHVLLVGQGANEFARQVGFKEEDLMTDRSRAAWLRWRTTMSQTDDWLSDEEIQRDFSTMPGLAELDDLGRPTGTITCLTLNARGDLSGTTTTSGLAYKIPGRVGDSPIIGCGLYVDNEVGACGSTGRGESVILINGSRTVVENMARGMSPEEACLDALKRIVDRTRSPRHLTAPGRPNFDVNFYCVNKRGEYAGARIYRGGRYAVHDGSTNGLRDSAYLFDRRP